MHWPCKKVALKNGAHEKKKVIIQYTISFNGCGSLYTAIYVYQR